MNNTNIAQKYSVLIPEGYFAIKASASRCTFSKKVTYTEVGMKKEVDRKVVTSGAKKLMLPEVINEIRRNQDVYESELHSFCLKINESLWLAPISERYRIKDLERIKAEGEAYIAWVILNYDSLITQWANICDENEKLPPKFGEVIRSNAFDISYIMEQCTYTLETDVDMRVEMGNSLMKSVAVDAKAYSFKLVEKARENKGTVRITSKSVEKMRTLRKKLNGMRLLDNRVAPAIAAIDTFLASVPADGKPSTENAKGLVTLLSLLSQPELLQITQTESSEEGQKIEPLRVPNATVLNKVTQAPRQEVSVASKLRYF